MTDENRVQLGHISGAHGVRGEVKIRTYTERPEDISAYGPLSDKTGARQFEIVSLRVIKNGFVVARLKDVADRNAAEALHGIALYVPRDRLPEPDEDEWYYSDLIGLHAVTPDGDEIGMVVAIQDFGAGDLLEIRPSDSRKTQLVPFTSECVPKVDIDGGQVIVRMPEEIVGEEQP